MEKRNFVSRSIKNDIQKIDVSIEKIGEATSQISKLLAVHDNRLDAGEEADEEIKKDIKVLHQRITEGAKEVVSAIHATEKSINETATTQHAKMSREINELDMKVPAELIDLHICSLNVNAVSSFVSALNTCV